MNYSNRFWNTLSFQPKKAFQKWILCEGAFFLVLKAENSMHHLIWSFEQFGTFESTILLINSGLHKKNFGWENWPSEIWTLRQPLGYMSRSISRKQTLVHPFKKQGWKRHEKEKLALLVQTMAINVRFRPKIIWRLCQLTFVPSSLVFVSNKWISHSEKKSI